MHTDLIRAGIITQDPLYRDNELVYNWIAKSCWIYQSAEFDFPNELDNSYFIRFEGIDTSAAILLNEHQIGATQNALRSHEFLLDQSILKSKGNELTIRIESALSQAVSNAKAYPYVVPASIYYNTWSEPSNRNFLRKSPKDFGWDWGPSFMPSGISGDILISAFRKGRLNGVVVEQSLSDDLSKATLSVLA